MKTREIILLCTLSFTPSFTPASADLAAETSRALPFEATEVELAGGQSHRWHVDLETDEFLHVLVEQQGIDVALEASAPDGEPLIQVDSPNGRRGFEPLTLIATAPGRYHIEVRVPSQEAPLGHYRIRAAPPQPASAKDLRHHAVERAQLEAHRAGRDRDAESFRESIRLYQGVLTQWRDLGNAFREGEVLLRLGSSLRVLGETPKAGEALQGARRIFHRLEDRFHEAAAWDQIGLWAWVQGLEEEALQACRSALAIWRALDAQAREANTLNTIGLVSFRSGRLAEAHRAYSEALDILRRIRDRRGEAATLHNIGGVLDLRGDPQGALENYRQALEVAREEGDRRFEAEVLHNRGQLYFRLGKAQDARDHYLAALPLFQQVGDQRREAKVLKGLGILHLWLRDYDRALSEFSRAIEIERERDDSQARAWSLFYLGSVYLRMGALPRALAFFDKSLELLQDFNDPRGRAAILTEVGSSLIQAGKPAEALPPLNEALELRIQLGGVLGQAKVLFYRGLAHRAVKRPDSALKDLHRALELSREVEASRRETEVLTALAGVEKDQGRLRSASAYSKRALELAESLRAGIAGKDLRASFFTSLRDTYELSIDLLIRRSRSESDPSLIERAFEIAERAQARSFLDQLQEARLDLRRGVDPKLLARESKAQLELDHQTERRRKLLRKATGVDQTNALKASIEQLLRKLEDVETEIREASPRYAALTQPPNWSLGELQRKGLDEGTVLLKYFLGQNRSYLWVLTNRSLAVHELPARGRLESLVRQVHKDLKSVDPQDAGGQRERLNTLSELLLGPLEDDLQSLHHQKRLVIVADGALQYLPFAILPMAGKPVIVNHEIAHLPSAMVLDELRRPRSRQPEPPGETSPGKVLAVFADPVFSTDDPRILPAPSPKGSLASRDLDDGPELNETVLNETVLDETGLNEAELTRAGSTRGKLATQYKRLPWTRREADAILESARRAVDEDRLFLATGFDSYLQAVQSPVVRGVEILHFATHGEIDAKNPRLSALVLSQFTKAGQSRSGFLRLHHIYGLELEAQLVVLSGCGTALGQDILGEGLQSLTRGFFHAGAPRVMASLWSVQDEATAELMGRFYKALFTEELTPAAALRSAQISMWQERRFRDPFYWGAFVIQGDWQGGPRTK